MVQAIVLNNIGLGSQSINIRIEGYNATPSVSPTATPSVEPTPTESPSSAPDHIADSRAFGEYRVCQ